MYKDASRLKLRFFTGVGVITTEDLWDLSLKALSDLIKNLKEKLDEHNVKDLDFLEENFKKIDEIDQLRFNIAKDVYLTRKEIANKAKEAAKIKEHNQKIMELIHKKQNEELENMSIEDLKKLMK